MALDATGALLLTLVPWIELNGSIPISLALGLNPFVVFVAAVVINIATFFPIYFGLEKFYKIFQNWGFFKWSSRWALKRADKVKKYGIPGLALYIGLPGPFTGVYSATLIAWLLRMNWKHAFISVTLGVILAASVLFVLSYGFLSAVKLLV